MIDKTELIEEIARTKEAMAPIINNFYDRTGFQIISISVCNVYEKTNCGQRQVDTSIDITIKP